VAGTVDLERRLDQQRALLQIARAVSSHLERDKVFTAISRAVGKLIAFDKMALMMPSSSGKALVLYALDGEHDEDTVYQGREYPVNDDSAVRRVLETGETMIASRLEDLKEFPLAVAALKEVGASSCIIQPLIAKQQPIAVFVLMSQAQNAFDDADLTVIREMADTIAAALFNSLQYEENERLRSLLAAENRYLRESFVAEAGDAIVGTSAPMQTLLEAAERVAATDSTVLITGETGTGKELVASGIHRLSARRDRMIVKVNCAAISAGVVESELFGHERGAFTGAHQSREGRFELANAGTLFLDEVGELGAETQAKLLRVLQQGEFERVGSSETRRVDVRVIAATNRDLRELASSGAFREDLYYRLSVFPIDVPPLRRRREDIPALVEHFVAESARRLGKPLDGVTEGTLARLIAYDWPGNVRELRNVIERASILADGPEVRIDDVHPSAPRPPAEASRNLTLEQVERDHIIAVLEQCGWTVGGEQGAAAKLGLNPNTLRSRMQKLGIRRPERA
jgi:formate hydrogenlyase transcriptional activator